MKFLYASLFAMLFFACNNPSKNFSKDEKRINDWSKRIINSRDSIKAKDTFYSKEVEAWYKMYNKSEDKQLISKIDFINAKILSWTKKDSISQLFFKKCIPELEKNEAENSFLLIDGYYNLCIPDVMQGHLNAALIPLTKSVYYSDRNKSNDTLVKNFILRTYSDYGAINRVLLNNDLAIKYLNKATTLAKELNNKGILIKAQAEKATTLNQMNKNVEAIEAIKIAEKLAEENNMKQRFVYNHLANLYGNQKQFEKALAYIQKEENAGIKDSLTYHINKSGANLGLQNTEKAKSHIIYLENNFNQFSELDKQLSLFNIVNYYLQTRNFEKAKFYFNQSEKINNDYFSSEKALYSEDLIKKYELNQKQDEIELLNKSNKLLDEELKNKTLYFVLILLLIFIILTIIIILYLKQKNNKLALETKLVQIEDKLLRSQMEPHFVFNAMSSLQSLILENKNTESSYYLAKFARILRLSLEHSRKKYVSFSEELEAVENYLDLQKLRFGNLFEYKIVNNITTIENLEVPPMMIQPFVENSIYHGFKNIDYQGELLISFKLTDSFIECTIKDNGKGLTNEENLDKKDKTSLSTIITKERLQILTNSKNISGLIEIKNNPKSENGTVVKVKLPFIKD
jgi:hypothetical protein